MTGLWFLAPAVLLLTGLLYFEKRENRRGMVPVKGMLSILFVVVCVLQPWPIPVYGGWILTGLCLSLVGDILLALPGSRPFLLGLGCFLTGHVAYITAFFAVASPGIVTLPTAVPVAAVSIGIYRWLASHLGTMKGPVLAYILVISAMLAAATNFGWVWRSAGPAAAMAVSGALAFYLSDLFVARDRFVSTGIQNRYAGLPLYYAGQFLLAYSTAMPGLG